MKRKNRKDKNIDQLIHIFPKQKTFIPISWLSQRKKEIPTSHALSQVTSLFSLAKKKKSCSYIFLTLNLCSQCNWMSEQLAIGVSFEAKLCTNSCDAHVLHMHMFHLIQVVGHIAD